MNSKKGYEAPELGVIVLSSLEEALVANCPDRGPRHQYALLLFLLTYRSRA